MQAITSGWASSPVCAVVVILQGWGCVTVLCLLYTAFMQIARERHVVASALKENVCNTLVCAQPLPRGAEHGRGRLLSVIGLRAEYNPS